MPCGHQHHPRRRGAGLDQRERLRGRVRARSRAARTRRARTASASAPSAAARSAASGRSPSSPRPFPRAIESTPRRPRAPRSPAPGWSPHPRRPPAADRREPRPAPAAPDGRPRLAAPSATSRLIPGRASSCTQRSRDSRARWPQERAAGDRQHHDGRGDPRAARRPAPRAAPCRSISAARLDQRLVELASRGDSAPPDPWPARAPAPRPGGGGVAGLSAVTSAARRASSRPSPPRSTALERAVPVSMR